MAGIFAISPVFAQEAVIAALGDSLTQGYGLAPDVGLVPQLEAWLRAQGADLRLINAGVSGDTTAGGLARAAWTLTPEVQGLIVALGGNDMLRGIDPAAVRANLDGILSAGQAAGVAMLLVGFPAPGNYGADYKRDFDAIYPDLAAKYGAVLIPDMLAPLAEATADGTPITDFLQADRLHPSRDGVALIVAGMGPKVLEMLALIDR